MHKVNFFAGANISVASIMIFYTDVTSERGSQVWENLFKKSYRPYFESIYANKAVKSNRMSEFKSNSAKVLTHCEKLKIVSASLFADDLEMIVDDILMVSS